MEEYKEDLNLLETDHEAPNEAPAPDPNRKLYLMLPVALLIGVLIGYAIWGMDSTGEQTAQAPAENAAAVIPTTEPGEIQRFPVDADDDPVFGPSDAPIQLIEFGDYNCGYCRKFHTESFQALLDTYPGQIQFVYRDFPILGQTSLDAAVAANCAGDQDMYWEYHDLLYSGRMALGTEAYTQYAEDLNLDANQFSECLAGETHNSEIIADAEFVAALGARGTPVFFINGIPLIGAAPLEQFYAIIDSELSAE
ncbi:MAG: DsbA family protein [Anaerolineales bacterium]|nr:DsbA family protein [Anaerolineales bacterium]